ncbi:Stage II sporulation protein E (SpoIIE) [Streptomyces sp. WMMB 714]|uniref:ATP-binding SpoIIE family protein phosphatase n=1 Tax=Streptomyces sp. WMMB 714 TaxID=1286822 RepID=UPI00082395DD|nr:ATP-binding SpoIIE family protein phosphatase [Streptomyces sp. WMMB 714]SCK31797.1 Stage II sporulation protein E (SpoIIE) [Streptomyces sp. WMMB 714]
MRLPFSGLSDPVTRTALSASQLAPARARTLVRAAISEGPPPAGTDAWKLERLADDAALLVSELVTNSLMHAGTDVEIACGLETAGQGPGGTAAAPGEPGGPADGGQLTGVLVEVADRQPSGRFTGDTSGRRGRGLGLQIVGALAESWGVTYRRTEKVVWFRLAISEIVPAPAGALSEAMHRELDAAEIFSPSAQADRRRVAEWTDRGGAFLAEASELLAGQLDEDMVAALAGQLLVPRLADWCAVWLTTDSGAMRLSRVWHADERRVDALRFALEPDPPPPTLRTVGIPWPWPEGPDEDGTGGSALAFSLVSGGTCVGSLVIGRAGPPETTDTVARTVEDVARRVAQAVVTARQYTRQTSISRALQRRQLPPSLASLPGVESAIVYEPHGRGQTVGGDFYDLFPMGNGRWAFLLGDVQGKDPEAMSVTGLTRHLVRLLAREGHGVESVLGRLNAAMAEEGAEAVAVGGESAQPRFLSLVYGELQPDPEAGGAHCTLASAGHPPPLKLSPGTGVVRVAEQQMLLGIDDGTEFTAYPFDLAPGETLLCVTDGVTERRSGHRQLDDDDGLAEIFAGCGGMGAMAVAERVRQAAHDFGPEPVEDDLAILVLHAVAG